jgi:hypothetical protein
MNFYQDILQIPKALTPTFSVPKLDNYAQLQDLKAASLLTTKTKTG